MADMEVSTVIQVTVRVEIMRADGTRTVSEETAVTSSGNPRFEAHAAGAAATAAAEVAVGRLGDPTDAPLNGMSPPLVAGR